MGLSTKYLFDAKRDYSMNRNELCCSESVLTETTQQYPSIELQHVK